MEKRDKSTTSRQDKFTLNTFFSSLKSIFFSTQSSIGVDIGTSYVKFAQLRRVKGGYVVVNYFVRALPQTAKGHLEERNRLVKEFLKEFMEETKVKTTLSRLAISGPKVYIFSLVLPPLSEKDLKGAINIELKKRLPFQVDINSLFISYVIADKFHNEKGEQLQVSCVAVDNFFLNESIKVLKEVGLRPVGVNVIPDALGNLISFLPEDYSHSVILDMGTEESSLNFYKKGVLQFSRQIAIGGNHFTKAVMRAISSFGEKKITFEDAEKVKRECGIPLEEESSQEYFTDFGLTRGVDLSAVLRPILDRLINEIVRTVNYYYRAFRVKKIDGFFLSGGSSRLKNIDKFLKYNLSPGLKIDNLQRLNPLKVTRGWMEVGISKHELMVAEASPHLAACFGLCLGKGGKINLLPPKEKIEQKVQFFATIVKLVSPLLLVIMGGFYVYTYGKVFTYKKLIRQTEEEINRLHPIIERTKEYQNLQKELAERETLLKKAIGRQPLWAGILKELTLITPKGIVLNRLEVERGKGVFQIKLRGEVFSLYTTVDLVLSQYLVNLDESPFFSNVRLLSTQKDIYSSLPKANFEIVAQLLY